MRSLIIFDLNLLIDLFNWPYNEKPKGETGKTRRKKKKEKIHERLLEKKKNNFSAHFQNSIFIDFIDTIYNYK